MDPEDLSERSSNTTKIETGAKRVKTLSTEKSERSSNTTKIETALPLIFPNIGNSSERSSNTTKIETLPVSHNNNNKIVRKKF